MPPNEYRPASKPVAAGFSHAQVKAPTYYFKKFIEGRATTVGAGHVWIATDCGPNPKAQLRTMGASPETNLCPPSEGQSEARTNPNFFHVALYI